MKRIKLLLEYIIYFVIGNLVFNTIYSSVEVVIINNIGGYELFSKRFIESFKETIIIYITIYLILIIVCNIYKKTTINKLNNKLKNIRGGGKK